MTTANFDPYMNGTLHEPVSDVPLDSLPPLSSDAPAMVAAAEPLSAPTHAGLAVQALDTGRILMLQRALDPEDPAAGKWEFPGGSIDGDETPLEGARREWTEETGMLAPALDPVGGWVSPDGVYEAFVVQVLMESDLALNPDVHEGDGNPDDPERETPEVTAWLSVEDVQAMGEAIRREVREGTDWSQFTETVTTPVTEETPEAAMTAAGDYDWAAAIVGARLGGASYAELADQFGYTSAGAARKAVMRALEAAETPQDATTAPEATLTAADAPVAPLLPEDMPAPDGAPALAQDIDPDGEPFYGIVAPEGVPSDDSREFGIESMLARDLPLPLMYQDAQLAGHDGAVRVGRIDNVWRDTTTYAVPMIRYDGVWDTSEIAAEAQRQVEKGVAKGVSVDGVDVTTRLVDANGNTLDPMADDFPEDGVIIEHADQVKMAGLTICSVPAFEQTYIANGRYADRTEPEPGQTPREPLPSGDAEAPSGDTVVVEQTDEEMTAAITELMTAPLVASAPAWTIGLVASANGEGDWVVPAAHFTDPGLTEPTALTVDPDGRVYGHLATWGQCHIGQAAGRRGEQVRAAGKCMEVPTSASGYAFFATGVVHTDNGETVNVGQLTMDTGHANLQLGAKQTVDHYDNTGAPVADIVVGHDAVGIWFSGHVRPTATPAQVYAMTASGSVSGDWREVVRRSNQLELVAALVVNVPGFPIGRPAVTASAHGPVALVASGAITPPHPQETPTGTPDAALVASLTREVMASIDRTQRAQAAAHRIRTHRATKAAARINTKGA